jgi:hypothetical protein
LVVRIGVIVIIRERRKGAGDGEEEDDDGSLGKLAQMAETTFEEPLADG